MNSLQKKQKTLHNLTFKNLNYLKSYNGFNSSEKLRWIKHTILNKKNCDFGGVIYAISRKKHLNEYEYYNLVFEFNLDLK